MVRVQEWMREIAEDLEGPGLSDEDVVRVCGEFMPKKMGMMELAASLGYEESEAGR